MAEAPRNMQLPSGYDEEFLYAVEDDFICLICHLLLKEPASSYKMWSQILQCMPRGIFEKVRMND